MQEKSPLFCSRGHEQLTVCHSFIICCQAAALPGEQSLLILPCQVAQTAEEEQGIFEHRNWDYFNHHLPQAVGVIVTFELRGTGLGPLLQDAVGVDNVLAELGVQLWVVAESLELLHQLGVAPRHLGPEGFIHLPTQLVCGNLQTNQDRKPR